VEREIFEYSHCVEGCVLEVPMKQHMRRVSTMHMSRRCTSLVDLHSPYSPVPECSTPALPGGPSGGFVKNEHSCQNDIEMQPPLTCSHAPNAPTVIEKEGSYFLHSIDHSLLFLFVCFSDV
jgi:hypothetical protein